MVCYLVISLYGIRNIKTVVCLRLEDLWCWSDWCWWHLQLQAWLLSTTPRVTLPPVFLRVFLQADAIVLDIVSSSLNVSLDVLSIVWVTPERSVVALTILQSVSVYPVHHIFLYCLSSVLFCVLTLFQYCIITTAWAASFQSKGATTLFIPITCIHDLSVYITYQSVNRELCLLAQPLLHYKPVQRPHYCGFHMNATLRYHNISTTVTHCQSGGTQCFENHAEILPYVSEIALGLLNSERLLT